MHQLLVVAESRCSFTDSLHVERAACTSLMTWGLRQRIITVVALSKCHHLQPSDLQDWARSTRDGTKNGFVCAATVATLTVHIDKVTEMIRPTQRTQKDLLTHVSGINAISKGLSGSHAPRVAVHRRSGKSVEQGVNETELETGWSVSDDRGQGDEVTCRRLLRCKLHPLTEPRYQGVGRDVSCPIRWIHL